MSRESPPAALGKQLRSVLKGIDRDGAIGSLDLWQVWNEVVGDHIAKRAQPSGFRNGVLFVTVGSHSWMQELQMRKEQLRANLNARLNAEKVRDIQFLAGVIEVPIAKAERNDAAEAERELRASAEVDLPEIADPRLAQAFADVMAARTRRADSARSAAETKKRRR